MADVPGRVAGPPRRFAHAGRRLRRAAGRRFPVVVAAALAVAIVAGLVIWNAWGGGAGYRTDDRMLTVRSGPSGDEPVRLDTRVYVPDTATAEQPGATVLLAHGLGGTKDSVRGDAEDLAERGYVVLTWTARGFGKSGGQIHLDSPDYEVTDARRLLDWLATRSYVRRDGPGDPRVGVLGGSYGGALALLLAGYDQRVDAVIPQVTWSNLARALFPESTGKAPTAGVFKRAWTGSLFSSGFGSSGALDEPEPGSDSGGGAPGQPQQGVPGSPASPGTGAPGCGRFALELCLMYQRVATSGRADPETVRLLERSSPASVLDRIEAPTFLIQGTADTLFPLSEADSNAYGIRTNGTRTPVKVAWFAGGHDGGSGSEFDQQRMRHLSFEWLDAYLRGITPPPNLSFMFSRVVGVSYEENAVRTAGLISQVYPGLDGDSRDRTVRLSGRPRVIANPPGGTPAARSSLPGESALTAAGAAGGSVEDLVDRLARDLPGQHAAFESEPLRSTVDVTGSPTVRIRAASPTGEAVLFVKVYDVGPDGQASLLGGQVAPVRLTGLPRSAESAAPVKVTLPGIVHRFSPDHRVRISIASADQAYAGPTDAQVYAVGLDDNAVHLPQVTVEPVSDPAGPWFVALAGLVGALGLGLLVAWRVAVRRGDGAAGAGTVAGAEDADTPLVVRGLSKTYADGLVALQGVDFTVRRGEVVGLLGPNGAGKTTCLRVLLGLIQPTDGEVRVFGQRLSPGAPVLERLGALVEGPGFLPHLSGLANLELFWEATGRPSAESQLDEVLDVAGLGSAIHRKVRTYSHGMKQRLAIAQAMLGMPELLVLDEPTDGLDPPQIVEMRHVLHRYSAGGRAVLVSSHLLAEVEQTCTHVVVLHLGERAAAGPVADVVGDSPTVLVKVTDLALAERVLGDLAGIRTVARQDGELVVDLDGLPRSELVRALVVGGVGVERMTQRRRLEDAFLTLVGGTPP